MPSRCRTIGGDRRTYVEAQVVPPVFFSAEFKIGIVCRMPAGENVSALARALKMTRNNLYAWRDRFKDARREAGHLA